MSLANTFIPLPALAQIALRSPLTIDPNQSVAAALALMSQAQGSHCDLIAADPDLLAGVGDLQRDLGECWERNECIREAHT